MSPRRRRARRGAVARAVLRAAVALAMALGAGARAAVEEPRTSPPGAGETEAPRPAGEGAFEEVLGAADAAYRREDFAKARLLYEQAVRLRPEALHPLRRLALLQSWDGDLHASIDSYREALVLAPNDLEINLELAQVLAWDAQYRASIDLYRDLRDRRPDDARVLLGLGRALAWAGRFSEAETLYRDMEQRQIEPIGAHLGRARVLAWQGRLDEAVDFYRDVLKAEPGNLEARIGLAQVNHWRGQERAAKAQIDNIVLDHPGSRDAKRLQEEIHDALRPALGVEGFRFSDNESNRVDGATVSGSLMAEPQTSVRVALSSYAATWRCDAAQYCNEPGLSVGDEVADDAAALVAGVTSRVIQPILFHARIGAVRETTFANATRTVLVGGGFIRWQVGPRFAVTGTAAREALLDTAVLIDRGIKVDWADMRLEQRFKPRWLLFGNGGFGLYSDGNVRWAGSAGVEWRIRDARPRLTLTFVASYRNFREDLNNGYFDPRRYDAELVVLSLGDRYHRNRWYWQVEATYGRQDFATAPGSPAAAGSDDRVQGLYAAAGLNMARRVALEAYYWRTDYALQIATGFTSTKTGLTFRFRL